MKKRLTENFDSTTGNLFDISNSHYFLTTSILPGKVDIINLKETNPNHTKYYYVDPREAKIEITDPNVVEHRPSKLSFPKIKNKLTCINDKDPINQIIKRYQPYMYDESEIINYYDKPFYRDWRYPERPIDIKFAINPNKYSVENPHIYPSFKHLSKW